MPLVFKDHTLLVGGLTLPAPLRPFGHVKLFDAVKGLSHDDLLKLAEELLVPTHGLIPTYELMLTVGSVLQKRWFTEMGDVPAGVEKNYVARWAKHAQLIADLKSGKVGKMKKEKAVKAKSPKKEKAMRKSLLYAILRSKLEGPFAKKVENPAVTSHTPLVAQVLLTKPDRAWPLGELVEAVEKTKRYDGKGKREGNVRNDLRALEKLGVVKVTEAA